MRKFSKKARPGLQLLLLGTLLLVPTMGMAQLGVPFKKPVPDVTDSVMLNFEKLKMEFGENKEMPPQYEKQILYALSYFPELVDTKIKFRIMKSKKGIIDTRPTMGGLLRKGSKRKYLVTMYDSIDGRTLPQFSNAGVNGQVGIVGHELSHIISFKNSTGPGLAGLAIAHISARFMDRYENNTDRVNVERGLGYQLIAWKQYLDKGFKAMRLNDSPQVKKPERERYMSVEQIQQVMAKSKGYQL